MRRIRVFPLVASVRVGDAQKSVHVVCTQSPGGDNDAFRAALYWTRMNN